MKNLVLGIVLVMSCFSFSSQASAEVMAEVQLSGNISDTQELIKLFATQAAKPQSNLNKYMTALKSNPVNKDYTIEDTIYEMDIVRLESGASAGTYEINYLILIRAGYKSNTFQVGYLRAQVIGSNEDENQPTLIRIVGPAQVSIDD